MKIFSTVFEYDPVKDTFTKKADMPTKRGSLGTVVFEGKIYAFGGVNLAVGGVNLRWKPLDVVEVYDPVTNRWTIKRTMPVPMSLFSIGVVNGKIYLIGGTNERGVFARVDIYDPNTNAWAVGEAPLMPAARTGAWASKVDGKIYVVGGLVRGGAISRLVLVPFSAPLEKGLVLW